MSSMSESKIYLFGVDSQYHHDSDINILGGKGANLAEMSKIGVPVPPGLTIPTSICNFYLEHNKYPSNLKALVKDGITCIEEQTGKEFGCIDNPLLVSVRSGARQSMPGMMETVLNVGLTQQTISGLINKTGNPVFVLDSYRRLITMYADVVMDKTEFSENNINIRLRLEKILEKTKHNLGYTQDSELKHQDLLTLIDSYKLEIKEAFGVEFPENHHDQLWGAITAVFKSWNGERAREYRRIENIPSQWGTAVNIQAMVFGNMGDKSATGVAFTRNPSTGENDIYGEWLPNAQGEDVVAGIRTPNPLNEFSKNIHSKELETLEQRFPVIFTDIVNIKNRLESHYLDMQDIEFTIENNKLWMLQTRSAKRNGIASIKIALDMYKENLISDQDVLLRVDALQINETMLPIIKNIDKLDSKAQAVGLPAGPGAAHGMIVLSADRAEKEKSNGNAVILVRHETSPEDIHGMHASEGILTSMGGMTSHAALVARGWGKSCIVGCSDININYDDKTIKINNTIYHEGDYLTLDGSTGLVYAKKLDLSYPDISSNVHYSQLMDIADGYRKLDIRTNADTGEDAKKALSFGAQGIGLCRTEHMFFDPERIQWMRLMIFAENKDERQQALEKLLPFQREDFYKILKTMDSKPVTIRLLDPPLHEFINLTDNDIDDLSKKFDLNRESLLSRIESLKESNPMLGHRGCRLAISYPEIAEMQVTAIMQASIQLTKEGHMPLPEIMVPLISSVNEFLHQKNIIVEKADKLQKNSQTNINYLIGTMIELPRACFITHEIAKHADFISFGTNDLTQTTFGFSRDDIGSFIGNYLKKSILPKDPFISIDRDGVGKLVKRAVAGARSTNKSIKIGICGEHGGDPESIAFFNELDFDYVSCSPFRVPVARLASAQVQISSESNL